MRYVLFIYTFKASTTAVSYSPYETQFNAIYNGATGKIIITDVMYIVRLNEIRLA